MAEIIPPARATSDHARHDALLIAAHAAGDLEGVERSRAEQLVAACHECTALERDLRAIALATTAANLPVPPRPRSFTLEPTDAARIRPSGWRGLIRRFASPDLSFTRPLAAGLTTLGLAGLLVAAMPGGLSSLGGSAAAPMALPSTAAAAPSRLSQQPPGVPEATVGIAGEPSSSGVPAARPSASGDIAAEPSLSTGGGEAFSASPSRQNGVDAASPRPAPSDVHVAPVVTPRSDADVPWLPIG